MRQIPLIPAIHLLFVAVAVSGLPLQVLLHRHGGHHPNRHPHGQQNITGNGNVNGDGSNYKSSSKVTHSVGNAKSVESSESTQGPPPIPQISPEVPPPPPPVGGNNTEHSRMFGWDPKRAMGGCGPNCDAQKYLLQQEFLIAHNWVRLLFKLPLYTWDEKLASAARQYAMQRYDDCKMVHSDLPYGENIFWGLRLHWTPSDAVFFWFRESRWFNIKSVKCSAPKGKDCGHFTQIVWRDSMHLGCALQHCRDPSKGMLIVCEYDPPGNYDDENPLDDNNAKHQF